jgi:hypothetical protein
MSADVKELKARFRARQRCKCGFQVLPTRCSLGWQYGCPACGKQWIELPVIARALSRALRNAP